MKAIILLGALIVTGFQPALDWPWHHAKSTKGKSAPDLVVSSADPVTRYVIGSDDVLHVTVWKEPDLGATLPVRSDGKISLPLVSDVQGRWFDPNRIGGFSDFTVEEIRGRSARERYCFTNEPRPDLRDGRSAKSRTDFAFAGHDSIASPGYFGSDPVCKQKKIYVLRSVNGVEQRIRVNYKQVLRGNGMDQNIKLQAGDTIVVP